MKPFLAANWLHLSNITYAVGPSLLQHNPPRGLELDVIDGKAFVSLVPFSFTNTRLKGLRIPFHSDFSEMNLRFYVRFGERRGVVFIREYVPKYFVALIANNVYNERYAVAGMKNTVQHTPEEIYAKYELVKYGESFSVEVTAENNPFLPSQDSLEHYFKEHEFGCGADRTGNTRFYRVEHPVWEVMPVKELKVNMDFGILFGKQWEILNNAEPFKTMFIAGSGVKVFSHHPLSMLEV